LLFVTSPKCQNLTILLILLVGLQTLIVVEQQLHKLNLFFVFVVIIVTNWDTINRCHKRQRENDSNKKTSDWIKTAKCYNCSHRGHIAKDCRNKETRKGKYGSVHGVSEIEGTCPTKDVCVGNLTTKAIIDSGASVSCISYKLLCKAFPHGFDLCDTPSTLTGPSSTRNDFFPLSSGFPLFLEQGSIF